MNDKKKLVILPSNVVKRDFQNIEDNILNGLNRHRIRSISVKKNPSFLEKYSVLKYGCK